MVTLKLASTVFDGNRESTAPLSTSGNSGSPGSTPIKSGQRITATSGEEYHFDKNGAIVPYSAFVSLIDSAEFQEYLEKVKKLYYKEKATSENDNDDDDDDDEVLFDNIKKVAAAAKKRRATGKRKMKYGKSRRTIDFSSEDDENVEQRAPRSPTPIDSGEDSNRNAEKKVANLPDSDLESEKDQQENEKEQNDKKKEERRTRSSTEARK